MQILRLILLWLTIMLVSCQQKYIYRLQSHNLIGVDSLAGIDSTLLMFIKPFSDSISGVMTDVIGTNPKTLIPRKPESELTNFVADLVWEAGKSFLKEHNISGSEILCVVNIKGFRAPLPEGKITTRNIFELMPFENRLVAVKMNSENLLKLFDHIAQSEGDGLAGASFTIKKNKAFDIFVNGDSINEKKQYWVITSDYLADGGDNYTIFRSSDTHLVSNDKIRELIIAHIKELTRQNKKVEPDTTVRISVQE